MSETLEEEEARDRVTTRFNWPPKSEKSPGMDTALDKLSVSLFGRSRRAVECVTCGSPKTLPENFRTDLDRKEYGISRMCQSCQDSVFNHEEKAP